MTYSFTRSSSVPCKTGKTDATVRFQVVTIGLLCKTYDNLMVIMKGSESKLKRFLNTEQHLGFAISSIGTIPRTSKRSGYTHSLTCNLSSSSSQVTTLCGNPTVQCFSS